MYLFYYGLKTLSYFSLYKTIHPHLPQVTKLNISWQRELIWLLLQGNGLDKGPGVVDHHLHLGHQVEGVGGGMEGHDVCGVVVL